MIEALFKATVLLTLGLAGFRLLRGAGSALRHLICLSALAGTIVVAAVMIVPPRIGWTVQAPAAGIWAAAAAMPKVTNSFAAGLAWWLGAIWICGSAVFLGRYLGAILSLRRIVSRSTPNGDPAWANTLVEARAEFGLRPAAIELRFARVSSPALCGFLQPIVLLPPDAAVWPEPRRRTVLLHELAHFVRGDLWANALAAAATAIWWFHPLAWLLARRLWQAQESACDDRVLATGLPAPGYAELLFNMARQARSGPALECAMAGKSDLKQRIANVLDQARPRQTRRHMSVRVIVLAALTVSALVLFRPAGSRAQQAEKAGGDVKAPRLISKVEPQYTDDANNRGVEGRVVLNAVVAADGRIHEVEVVEPLDPGLDRNAIDAVRQWVFEPGTKHGKPVPVRASLHIVFKRR